MEKEKLKTLKDMEFRLSKAPHNLVVGSKKLRAEAVKWVKQFADRKDIVPKFVKEWDMGATQSFIDFFNLTSEDLE